MVLPKPGGPAVLGLSPTIVLIFAGLLVLWLFSAWEHHGIVWLFASIDVHAGAEIVTIPLLLAGLGIGALASQLGAVTVSAVPDAQSPEVGGLQNTATNLGASIGTALAGSLLIAALTASFLHGIEQNPAVPPQVSIQAATKLAGGIPFLSERRPADRAHQGRREQTGHPGRPGRKPASPPGRTAHRPGGPRPPHPDRTVLLHPDPQPAARVRRKITRACLNVAAAHASCGRPWLILELSRQGRAGKPRGFLWCRLTAFLIPPVLVAEST